MNKHIKYFLKGLGIAIISLFPIGFIIWFAELLASEKYPILGQSLFALVFVVTIYYIGKEVSK